MNNFLNGDRTSQKPTQQSWIQKPGFLRTYWIMGFNPAQKPGLLDN
ncbi:hypothetical protein QUA20_29465 [Microcoleus sp. Pol7_A1]